MNITIIGSGAIGGTLGAHMIRAGHDITLCDADADHVAAIRARGLIIEGPVNEFTVTAHAITPDELPDQIEHAIVAVKSLHTRAAAELLRGRLAPDGYVLTVQNGLTADHLIAAVGRDRVVSSFVNVGADVMAPGRILQGNVATFRVGELDGGRITARVLALADALPYAQPTDNVLGYLWGKEAYGAMLWAGAVSDLTIAEHLEDPRYRPVMIAIAREVLAQAPVPVESFDGFEPDDLEGSLDRLAEFNRDSAKKYSGIYRDLVVRKRKTEIDEMLRDINGPIFNKVAEIIHDIEDGRRVNTRANLDELAEFVAATTGGPGRPGRLMRIVDVLAVPVQAGFFFDDQLAIRAGAAHDGFDYAGEPLTPGFGRVRQPGEAVSVLLLLDDGGVEFGDCAAVQYSGAGGRDPLFAAARRGRRRRAGRRARAQERRPRRRVQDHLRPGRRADNRPRRRPAARRRPLRRQPGRARRGRAGPANRPWPRSSGTSMTPAPRSARSRCTPRPATTGTATPRR